MCFGGTVFPLLVLYVESMLFCIENINKREKGEEAEHRSWSVNDDNGRKLKVEYLDEEKRYQ